jgi:hypothetical protein
MGRRAASRRGLYEASRTSLTQVVSGLDPFVAADERLRVRRLELLEERAKALERGDEGKAQSLEQELSDLDVKSGAAEEANALEPCP